MHLFFQALLLLHSMPLCVCSAVAVPWGSASFILPNLCLPSFWGQLYYECLKIVLPPVSISYSFSETLDKRTWETISVSVWENTLLLLSSASLFYQSTSTYLSINSGASTVSPKNRCTMRSLIQVKRTEKRIHYI